MFFSDWGQCKLWSWHSPIFIRDPMLRSFGRVRFREPAQFVQTLQVQPEFGRRPEEMGESQSRIAGNSTSSVQDFGHTIVYALRFKGSCPAADSLGSSPPMTIFENIKAHVKAPVRNRFVYISGFSGSPANLIFALECHPKCHLITSDPSHAC